MAQSWPWDSQIAVKKKKKKKFSLHKAEQLLQDMELKKLKDEKQIGRLIRKSSKITGAYNSGLKTT